MSYCVAKLDLKNKRRYILSSIRSHTEMNIWLNNNGNKEYIYEVWKLGLLHSRWKWKNRKQKWGRMSTPQHIV
jgi:hypothetical protein